MSAQGFPKGFTLIEMLVVMAIIALLLTIALPRYFGSLNKSKEIALQENLRVIRVSIDKFYSDKGHYPDTLPALVEAGYLRAVPVDPVADSSATWILIPAKDSDVTGVVDVKSGAAGQTADGRPYESL
jgi:general secretion pathway protein G